MDDTTTGNTVLEGAATRRGGNGTAHGKAKTAAATAASGVEFKDTGPTVSPAGSDPDTIGASVAVRGDRADEAATVPRLRFRTAISDNALPLQFQSPAHYQIVRGEMNGQPFPALQMSRVVLRWFAWKRLSVYKILTLAAMVLVISIAVLRYTSLDSVVGQVVCYIRLPSRLTSSAQLLKSDVDSKFLLWKNSENFHAGRQSGIDISRVLDNHIHQGTSLRDAEAILRCAGFSVSRGLLRANVLGSVDVSEYQVVARKVLESFALIRTVEAVVLLVVTYRGAVDLGVKSSHASIVVNKL